jgi:hypothetical protein
MFVEVIIVEDMVSAASFGYRFSLIVPSGKEVEFGLVKAVVLL